MIELPVQKRSASATKPKRGLDHSTSSSAKRDRSTMPARLAAAANSMAKSRSETASSEFGHSASNPELDADALAIDGEGRAGERGRAERHAG